MDTHKNARLTPKGREEMIRAVVDDGLTKAAAARKFNTTPRTVGKWIRRFLVEGVGSTSISKSSAGMSGVLCKGFL
jgi:transposase-like protein